MRWPKREKNMMLLLSLAKSKMREEEVAEKSGVSVGTISGLLNNRQIPRRDTAEKLARVFSVKVEDLFPEMVEVKAADQRTP